MKELCLVYMTASSMEEARKLKDKLVEERLAACVNIIPNMESSYWWKGKMEMAREVSIIAKTRKSLLGRLTKRVKELHSYTVPCVVAIPIIGGNKDFLDWIEKDTEKE